MPQAPRGSIFRLKLQQVHRDMTIGILAHTPTSSHGCGYRPSGSYATKFSRMWPQIFRHLHL